MNLHMSLGGKAAGREQWRSSPRYTGALPALKGLVVLTEVGLRLDGSCAAMGPQQPACTASTSELEPPS